MFNVTLSGDNAEGIPQNYAYTISDEFKDFTYTVGETSYSGKTLIDYVATLNDNSDELNDFALAARTYISDNSIAANGTVTATDANTAVIEVAELGYYLVTATANPTDIGSSPDPIKVTITATANADTTDIASVSIYQDDSADPVDHIGVLNNSGSLLPITGGIGTIIFYIIGGVLVVGVVIILITRMRVSRRKNDR